MVISDEVDAKSDALRAGALPDDAIELSQWLAHMGLVPQAALTLRLAVVDALRARRGRHEAGDVERLRELVQQLGEAVDGRRDWDANWVTQTEAGLQELASDAGQKHSTHEDSATSTVQR